MRYTITAQYSASGLTIDHDASIEVEESRVLAEVRRLIASEAAVIQIKRIRQAVKATVRDIE